MSSDAPGDAVVIVDASGRVVTATAAAASIFRSAPADLEGQALEPLLSRVTQLAARHTPLPTGGEVVVLAPHTPFEFMVEGSAEEVYLARRDGSLAYVNEAAARSVGYSRPELLALGVTAIDPVFGERFSSHVDELMRRDEVPPFETVHRAKDGRELTKEMRSAHLRIDGEDYVCGFGRDVTERKQAEARLQLLTRLHAMRSAVNEAVVRRPERQALFAALCRVAVEAGRFRMAWLGLVGDDGLVRPVASAGHVEGYLDGLAIALDSHGPTATAIREGRLDVCTDFATEPRMALWRERALSRGYLASAAVPLRTGGKVVGALNFYASLRDPFSTEERELLGDIGADVSFALDAMASAEERRRADHERQLLAAQLRQAQKLESIGQLAGGVAHDFNNMLTIILSNAELGLMRQARAEDVQSALSEIRDAAQRSAELTRQLLAFARKQPVKPRALDLNEAIDASLKLLRRLIGEQIALHWNPAPELCPVFADAGQLSQVLANLAVNARDAITGTGQLTISTESRPNRGGEGDWVALRVADDGAGMTPEVRAHLFEPFFTTKGAGRGTGLGLATVYGIVKQHGGSIDVSSAPGQGTTFTIVLPRHTASPDETPAAKPVAAGGSARVLLVEDEPTVLSITRKLLTGLGYGVTAVPRPEEALALVREPGRAAFDLLLTDVVMPGMNGRELAAALKREQPRLVTLFMSGYTADLLPQELEEAQLLAKPFTPEELALAVERALQRRG